MKRVVWLAGAVLVGLGVSFAWFYLEERRMDREYLRIRRRYPHEPHLAGDVRLKVFPHDVVFRRVDKPFGE